MKNLLNSVMLFLLLFIGQNAWGQEVVASGDLTSTITWSVEQTGTDSYTLNITGYGDMPDYSGLKDMPWAKCQSAYGVTTNYNSMITELNIDSRITKIGRRTFVKAESITSVTIPENCVSIGQEAFRFCSGLKEIYIPSSVTSIGTDAFSNCRSLDLIHYDARCDANTGIAFSNVAASGKIIEKSGTGASYANVPEGWEYYTHGEQCTRKAWVAENASGDKLFIYGQNPGARVNYAASGAVYNTDSPEYHPWRVNCWKYKSLEINRNVSVIESNELCGYSDNGVGKEGFASLETITVESGNESFVVGEDGALYNAAMTSIRLYPVTNTATHIDIPSTITSIGSGAFYATKNLQSVTFHANSLYFGQYSFARTSLNFIYFDTSQASLSWSATSFTGVAEEGVVAANGETNAFKNFTSMIGSGWTFDGETYGPARTYISDGTLYVVGKGEYLTSSSSASWYSQRSSIKKIVVKEGITDIGGSAFANCSNVTEATLNNNGKIGYSAFKDCSALTRVNIGGGVNNFDYSYRAQDAWHYTETVDAFPFEGCSKLATINVTDLASYCPISNLKYLTDREFGTASVKTLMVNGTTHSSTSELVIPENVSSISPYAFRYFSNVTKIKLPSKMTEIASSNFYGHTYLTEITVPSTVSSVGSSAFSGCTSLKTAILNNNGDIGYSAFSGCTALQTVTLNNNGYVDYYAFKDCSALTRINIGSGVSAFKSYSYLNSDFLTVHCYPFAGCSKLASVNTTDLKAFCSIGNLEYLTNSEYGTDTDKILLINGLIHSYTSALVIPDDVTSISPYAFRYFSNVTKIKLPSKMTEIASSNFYGHTYLTEITVPSTVSSVGSSAFSGCTSLKTAILNNNGDIGYSAFSGCTALQTVTLNNNGYVDYYAFKDCSALTRINIGSGVSAFKSYSYLNSDFLTVHCYPFSGCSKLATINVTDLVSFNKILDLGYLTNSDYGTAEKKTLMINGEGVWGDEILYLPEEITSYNNSALRYFSNVQRISLPSTMTTVSGFNDHSYLTHVTLSSKVESVTKNAFANCSNLKRIVCLATTCPSTTGSIATEPSSITLKVPYGTASLYKAADVWKEFNVEGGKQYVYDIDIDVLQSVKLSNLHNILTTEKALSWNSSNTAVATVNDGVVTGTNFVYDGSTLQPAKYVKITAELEDGDSYFCGVHVTPKEVALTDGNAYRLATDLEAEKISYTRSFSKAGAWQALYLPFAFDVEEYKSDFDIAEIYAICPTNDTNGDGVLDSNDDKKFILAPLNTGSTQPNAPYMIRPKATKSYTIVSENTTLASAEINEVEFATSRTQYSVKGIYAADFYAVPGDNNIYVTASGGFGYAKTKNVNIKPNRWVLHEESKNYCSSTSNSNSKLANFTIEVLGEDLDETTAIKLINGETASEGAKNGSAYNLNGMKVDASKNLPSGLYIINGKKVFKK